MEQLIWVLTGSLMLFWITALTHEIEIKYNIDSFISSLIIYLIWIGAIVLLIHGFVIPIIVLVLIQIAVSAYLLCEEWY